jgi:hypothetical protein
LRASLIFSPSADNILPAEGNNMVFFGLKVRYFIQI